MTKRLPDWSALSRLDERVLLSSAGTSVTTAGALAATAWLRKRGHTPPYDRRWYAELTLRAGSSSFRLEISSEEWGFEFLHGGQSSWIRVKSLPFVHDRDDFRLLSRTPPLREILTWIRVLEDEHQISLSRRHAAVVTDVSGLEPDARAWLASG